MTPDSMLLVITNEDRYVATYNVPKKLNSSRAFVSRTNRGSAATTISDEIQTRRPCLGLDADNDADRVKSTLDPTRYSCVVVHRTTRLCPMA